MYHLPSKGEQSEQKDDTRRTSQICSWVQEGKEKINQNQFLATTT